MRIGNKSIICCIQSVKDTKFKAIHNNVYFRKEVFIVVFNLSKIQNLKRFTTGGITYNALARCIQSVKDTKFKAIHNQNPSDLPVNTLYSICQRYKI